MKNPVLEEYGRLAPAYDTRWSFYVEATARETMARLAVRPRDRILDVGCGTGVLLHQLSVSHPQARLCGVDPVPEMLDIARQRLPATIELCEAWAERIPYDDEVFDLVVSCNMFHYIPQPLTALTEMARVLRRGGQLVITDWCDDYLTCHICDWYLRLFNRAHFRTYDEGECLALLREAGYPAPRIERYKIDWLWGLMTARATKVAS